MLDVVVTGGQTGVDRAALDVAIELGIPYGGWCPAGGWAEDLTEPPGVLARYPGLAETATADPAERTRLNVRDSDATLVLSRSGAGSPGTEAALSTAESLGRPALVAHLDSPGVAADVRRYLGSLPPGTRLGIGGPRESEVPGIYEQARALLAEVLAELVA